MSPARTKRGVQKATGTFLLMLLVSLLAYGLHARIKQYLPESAFHPTQRVLYDKDAQSSKLVCATLVLVFRQTTIPVPQDVALAAQPRLIVRRDRQPGRIVPIPTPPHPFALFFRPPPALLS